MSLAVVFPGQGSQSVGMGGDFLDGDLARWFDTVCDSTDLPLKKLILQGPPDELEDTRVTQPAVFIVNHLIYRYLKETTSFEPDYFAGHSLGEYNALVCAGWADFEDILPVVVDRGQAMGEAADRVDGGMAALLRIDPEDAENVCRSISHDNNIDGNVQMALYNSPGQIVISGIHPALGVATKEAKEAGALKAVELDVSGPWHSQYMQSAVDPLRESLETVEWSTGLPVVSNVTGDMVQGSPLESLLSQLTQPVRWIRSIEKLLSEGVDTFIEVGPGDALKGMIERIVDETDKDPEIYNTDNLEDTRNLIEELGL